MVFILILSNAMWDNFVHKIYEKNELINILIDSKKQQQVFLECFVELVVAVDVGRVWDHVEKVDQVGEQIAQRRDLTAFKNHVETVFVENWLNWNIRVGKYHQSKLRQTADQISDQVKNK